MEKKVFLIAFAILFLASAHPTDAQQPNKIPRIGYLSRRGEPTPSNSDPNANAFQTGLSDLDYVDGKNIVIDFRYAEGKTDRLTGLVAELIQLKVDILVSGTTIAIRAAKQATQTIPIVMAITGGSGRGWASVDSLARPGGNVTGLTRLTQDLSGKRLELLRESVRKISRVGVLADTSAQATDRGFKSYESAARALKIQLQLLKVTGPTPDLDDAFLPWRWDALPR